MTSSCARAMDPIANTTNTHAQICRRREAEAGPKKLNIRLIKLVCWGCLSMPAAHESCNKTSCFRWPLKYNARASQGLPLCRRQTFVLNVANGSREKAGVRAGVAVGAMSAPIDWDRSRLSHHYWRLG